MHPQIYRQAIFLSLLFILFPFFSANSGLNADPLPVPPPPEKSVQLATAPSPLFSPEEIAAAKYRLDVRNISTDLMISFKWDQMNRVPDLLKQLGELAPQSAEYAYFNGLSLFSQGEKARALLSLKKSVQINREFDPAWNLMGLILNDAKRTSESEKAFQMAVSASPYDPTYIYNLAAALYRNGKLKDALDYASRAIELKNNYSNAYYLQAVIERDLGHDRESIASFSRARELGLNDTDFLLDFLRVLDRAGEDQKVLDVCEILSSRNQPEALRIHGRIRMKYGEYGKASDLFGRLIQTGQTEDSDYKNYLYSIYRSGQNAYSALKGLNVQDSYRQNLEKYLNTRIQEDRNAPMIQDPILNPAR